jgi:hypothetical protein
MNTRKTAAQQWRKHWYGMIVACLCCVLVGTFLAMIYGRTRPDYTWIVFGGNQDPGDGQCGGGAKDQLVAGGWVDAQHICQVQWKADIGSGTNAEVDQAMPAGKEALKECVSDCVIAGFSLGSMPALQLSAQTGHSADLTYIYGAPQPSPGIWHDQYEDNPFVETGIEQFGQLKPDRLAPAGTHNYFDGRDPYNNAAPQCSGPGNFALTLDGHRIITRAEADASRQWTGTDGVLEFEVVAPPPISSGADPSPFWSGCEFGDWHNTPNSPGPQTNPDQPFGKPSLPGIPGGSPIPSQEGNMPGLPLPAFPTP